LGKVAKKRSKEGFESLQIGSNNIFIRLSIFLKTNFQSFSNIKVLVSIENKKRERRGIY
jgi:hypothetical protein